MKLLVLACLLLALVSAEILPFDNSAIEKIFQQKQAALFLFIGDDDGEASALSAFTEYDETSPSIILSVSKKNDGHGLFDRLAEYLGVNTNNTPTILYLGDKADKYNYDLDDITKDNLADFVSRVQEGKVQQFLKSAPIPEDNGDAVKVVVGKNFKEVVLDSEKEVLVKFYAPWCGHCKTLAPHYEEAAKLLSNNPNVLLVKVDSTENEVAGVDIQGFPTLKYWGKDKTAEPLDFNGDRTAEGIVQWIK
jgi:protein disulfide-isomerase A1